MQRTPRARPIAAALLIGAAVLAGATSASGVQPQRLEVGADMPHRAAPFDLPAASAPRRTCGSSLRPTGTRSFAAVVRRPAAISSGVGGGRVLARVGRRDPNGYPTVLGVLDGRANGSCAPVAYRVQVPLPPNGRSGWVVAGAVRVFPVRSRIVVSLRRRRLVAYRDGRVVLRVPVAVGAPQTPTPVGRFFVNERWLLARPDGPFGVAALGLSGHSDVLRRWAQGGPIALHGTNEPWSIGRAASHGCVRLLNDDMRRLLALAPAGTLVEIRP